MSMHLDTQLYAAQHTCIHPNYHSGGAEIAGNWPPAWVGLPDRIPEVRRLHRRHLHRCHDPHLDDEQVRERHRALRPDIVGCTAITPAIYKAERLLKLAPRESTRRSSPCSAASTARSCTRRC